MTENRVKRRPRRRPWDDLRAAYMTLSVSVCLGCHNVDYVGQPPVAPERGGQGEQLPLHFFSRGQRFPTFRGSFHNYANAERHQDDKRKEVVVCCSPRIFESKFLSKLKVFIEVLPKMN